MGKTQRVGLQEGYTETGRKHCSLMPHTTRPSILSTNPTNRIRKDKVELLGIDEVVGDPVIMWTIFLEEGQLPVEPDGNLTTTWGDIKTD